MDRPTNRTDAADRSPRLASPESFVLPSRRAALDSCRTAIARGPILLTGQAGTGKTWLWRRLRSTSPASSRWYSVDLTPADGPADFYRLLGHQLGLVDPLEASRIGLIDLLTERHADGDRPILVVEEAQNLSTLIWEEVRVLANRLGEPGGFFGLVFAGQTSLVRRFSTRALAGIAARLAARIHLGPIDADETRDLLIQLHPGRDWSIDEVEILHRDSAGNPGRMLRTIRPIGMISASSSIEVDEVIRPEAVPGPSLTTHQWSPLIVEDHVIEVGWSADEELSEPKQTTESLPGVSSTTEVGEEEVRDHYAALQAWREWSENQARRVSIVPRSSESVTGEPSTEGGLESTKDLERDQTASPLNDRPTIWADTEQTFAPLGQLFSRLSRSREADYQADPE